VRGNAYHLWSGTHAARGNHRQIFLAKVDTVKVSGQGEVSAIVHDQGDGGRADPPQFACVGQHLPGTSLLISILDQVDAAGDKFVRKFGDWNGN
jgi:hypothetical protein